MSKPKKRWTHWLVMALKLAVFGILCWAIYHAIKSGNEQLGQHIWHVEPVWLVVSGLLYLVALVPPALFWHRVLLATGQPASLGETIRSYYIAQLGKYVPGKWMVILLRRIFLRDPRVEHTVVAASVFFDTFTMLAVGAAISALVLIIWHTSQTLLILLAIGATLLLGLPTVPWLFEFLLRTLGVTRLNPTAGKKFRKISWNLLLAGWGAMAISWLLQGMSLWATLRSLEEARGGPLYELSLHTAAVALSVVAGFLSQIPGGLAVREWVSAQLIQPVYGEGVAIVSAVIYRLVLVVSELSISIILYVVGWRRMPRVAEVAEAAETEMSLQSGG